MKIIRVKSWRKSPRSSMRSSRMKNSTFIIPTARFMRSYTFKLFALLVRAFCTRAQSTRVTSRVIRATYALYIRLFEYASRIAPFSPREEKNTKSIVGEILSLSLSLFLSLYCISRQFSPLLTEDIWALFFHSMSRSLLSHSRLFFSYRLPFTRA